MTELLQFTLFGLMLGCVYAIAAMGLVLTYNVSGVFNFSHGAVGMLAAFTYYELRVSVGIPTPIALVLVVFGLAPLLGIVIERLMRNFRGADFATSLVVTIALTISFLGLALRFFDPREARFMPPLLGDNRFVIAEVPISYDQVAQVVVAIAVAFGLRFLLFGTPLGARMRGVVDDPQLAGLHGVQSTKISRIGWMIGFVLAALGGVLFAGGQNLNAYVLTLLVLNAYGAAMVGRLTSLPLTVVGALLLGLLQQLTNVSWLWPDGNAGIDWLGEGFFLRLQLAIPGVFLIAAVLLVPSARLSSGSAIGREEPRVPSLRNSILGGVALVVVVALVANLGPTDLLVDLQRAMVVATVALSLVAVTGLSGQVSIAQYLFVGVGAFVAGSWTGTDGVIAMVAGGLVAALLGVIVALPAVRLKGLYLALSTFGAALIGREIVLGDNRVFGLGGISVPRPTILGIETTSDQSYAIWCAIAFSALAVLLGIVRRSFVGRQLTAVRDSELAAATMGLPVRTVKLVIFSFSAFIAGCAGSLYGGFSAAVQGSQFDPVNSLIVVLYAYVGGITTVLGAIIAGVLFASLSYVGAQYADFAGLIFVVIGAAAISLGKQPNGLAGIILGKIDDVRRSFRRPDPAAVESTPPTPDARVDETLVVETPAPVHARSNA